MSKLIKTAVIAISGFTGEELIKILLKHEYSEIVYLGNRLDTPDKKLSEIYPKFNNTNLICRNLEDMEKDLKQGELKTADVVFLALPHTVSMEIVKKLLDADKKVIDLSADHRIKDPAVYAKWYKTKHHPYPEILQKAVYGLPELYREKIKKASLISNPGCYPTTIILGCAPLLKEGLIEKNSILADSKSGYSGGGKAFAKKYLNENSMTYAYDIGRKHRHVPEMEQELLNIAPDKSHIYLNFNPHVVPQERGMLSAIYFRSISSISESEVIEKYKKFYKNEPFVRILTEGLLPQTCNVVNTNFCDIGFSIDEQNKYITVISTIDNLLKGASGQAVQNMNIMFGIDEKTGLS